MLPLAVLASLIGVGVYISRNELAETVEAPKPKKCSRGPASGVPKNPSPTSRAEAPEAPGPRAPGPRGEGLVAHFSDRQVGYHKQPPGILERNGAPGVGGPGPKKELPNFGAIQPNLPLQDIDRSRYLVGSRLDGTTPFTSERPRGEDSEMLHIAAQAKNVDELRSASNPKLAAHGRVTAPPMRGSLRGDQGTLQVRSNRNNCDDTSFAPGMSSVKRGASGGEFVVPDPSCRDGAPLPLSGAGRALGSRIPRDATLRDSDSTLCTPMGGVAGGERARNRDLDLEMFEQSTCEPERGDLAEPPLGGAHSSAMGSRGVPSGDALDMEYGASMNRRILTSKNPRLYGSMQVVNPPKQTTYEPGDPMRTTLKETMIHDQGDGWLRGPQRTSARDPDSTARATGRETLDDVQGASGDGRLSATTSVYKPPVYDPDDVAPTTVRETTERNTHSGHIGALEERGGHTQQPHLDQTQRALTQVSYFGDAAKPSGNGYQSVQLNNPGTNRMVSPVTDYRGSAGTQVPNMMTSKEVYTKVLGDARERVLRRRSPKGRREILPSGSDQVKQSRKGRIDPCLDFQPNRPGFQNQGRVQTHVALQCKTETRGGRQVADGTPDTSVLRQLDHNPYALKN